MASVSEEVRFLMARHLQSNVWADCAYNLENVKSVRWHLGSSGRSEGLWKEIMTVTKQKQCCFIQRVHFHFQVKRRQVRTPQHARMNPEAWDSMLEGVCFLVWVLDAMRVAMTDDGAAALFSSDVLRAAFQKVLEGLPDLYSTHSRFCAFRLLLSCFMLCHQGLLGRSGETQHAQAAGRETPGLLYVGGPLAKRSDQSHPQRLQGADFKARPGINSEAV